LNRPPAQEDAAAAGATDDDDDDFGWPDEEAISTNGDHG
jgi:hypothetical protein